MTTRREVFKLAALPILAFAGTAMAEPDFYLWKRSDVEDVIDSKEIQITSKCSYEEHVLKIIRFDQGPAYGGRRNGGLFPLIILAESIDNIEKSAQHYSLTVPGRIRSACESVANGYHVFNDGSSILVRKASVAIIGNVKLTRYTRTNGTYVSIAS